MVAFEPTYASIGVWSAIILTALRFIQGVGVGGEWGGSVLLSVEWTRTNAHRGFVRGRSTPCHTVGARSHPAACGTCN
jgi:MFS family permease